MKLKESVESVHSLLHHLAEIETRPGRNCPATLQADLKHGAENPILFRKSLIEDIISVVHLTVLLTAAQRPCLRRARSLDMTPI